MRHASWSFDWLLPFFSCPCKAGKGRAGSRSKRCRCFCLLVLWLISFRAQPDLEVASGGKFPQGHGIDTSCNYFCRFLCSCKAPAISNIPLPCCIHNCPSTELSSSQTCPSCLPHQLKCCHVKQLPRAVANPEFLPDFATLPIRLPAPAMKEVSRLIFPTRETERNFSSLLITLPPTE